MWGLSREDCVELAAKWEIPITVTKDKLYSIDDNLWGKAIECGAIEDPWAPAPDDVYTLTRVTETEPVEVVVGFAAGVPVSLDGESLDPEPLIAKLGRIAGSRGFGRLDMVENRRVGIKSREVYECPAALSLVVAHADLEDLTLERDLHHEKARLEPRWSELVYDGLWFSPLKSALDAFIAESQRHVTGEVRLRFAASRHVHRGRPPQPGGALRPRPGHLRRLGLLPPCGRRGIRAAVGTRRGHLVGPAGPGVGVGSRKRAVVMTLWKGRISTGMADTVADFTVSLPFDKVLAPDDLAGSRAHVKGLGKVGILTDGEVAHLLDTSDLVEEEVATGVFVFEPGDEDIHTAIERRVTELAGEVGAKLHTGRSRNDQIATDLRLWCRRSLVGWSAEVMALQDVLAQRAREAADVYLPGYTHLQRAQPVLLAHHLLAHGWALARDVDRLLVTVDRLNISPLGAGALAGSSLPLDPDFVAAELGFHGRFENSLDAVSDRDFVAEALFDIALLGVHLSRLGEELVLWSTEEFGFCTLDDAYATGSSMLPQKKNPDVAELARGKAGRLIGHLNAVLITLKGLPLAYNRDLQEDKEPLFDAVVQVTARPDRPARRVRHRDVERGAHAAGRRRPGRGGHRPGRDAGRAGHAVPSGPCAGRWHGPRLVGAPRAPGRAGGGASRAGGGRGRAPRARCGGHPPAHPGWRGPDPGGRAGRALRPAPRGGPDPPGPVGRGTAERTRRPDGDGAGLGRRGPRRARGQHARCPQRRRPAQAKGRDIG